MAFTCCIVKNNGVINSVAIPPVAVESRMPPITTAEVENYAIEAPN